MLWLYEKSTGNGCAVLNSVFCSFVGQGLFRQHDGKAGAYVFPGNDIKIAVMTIHNPFGNGEPQAVAAAEVL